MLVGLMNPQASGEWALSVSAMMATTAIFSGLYSLLLVRLRAYIYEVPQTGVEPSFLEFKVIGAARRLIEWAHHTENRWARIHELARTPREVGGGVALMNVTIILVCVGLTGIVMVLVVLRLCLLFWLAVAWALIFGPAQGLSWVAKRTGSEHYFNVGKYAILLATFLAASHRLWRSS